MAKVITGTPRTSLEIVDAFAKLGSATTHEAQGRIGLLDSRIRPIFPAAIAGNALTCEVAPGDNWTIHVAVEQAREGDILIVTPTSPCNDGYLGDLLAESLMAHGVRGVVIDAGVRDVSTLTEINFPVWSKCINSQGTVKQTLGNVQTSIVIANQRVEAGDVVVADNDGICIVRRRDAERVLAQAQSREQNEADKRARLRNGELGLDMYGMREDLKARGLTYEAYQGE
jgi:4-hydroxy-4-methyl-2-oxoglutarate aldolase